jgi:hypothetical protein
MNRKWSKEMIIERIKVLQNQNVDLSAGHMSKNHVPLFTAASSPRYFSHWANAVREAGIDYDQILEKGRLRRGQKLRKWSKSRVLEELRKFPALNLLTTTYRDRLALYSAARREFGDWKQALEQAGHLPKKDFSKKDSPQQTDKPSRCPRSARK